MTAVFIRPGVHVAPAGKGLYVVSARGSFMIKGAAPLFEGVDSLVDSLEDGLDEAALPNPADGGYVRALAAVVQAFRERGLILTEAAARAATQAVREIPGRRGMIEYLLERAEDPQASLRALAQTHVRVDESVPPSVREVLEDCLSTLGLDHDGDREIIISCEAGRQVGESLAVLIARASAAIVVTPVLEWPAARRVADEACTRTELWATGVLGPLHDALAANFAVHQILLDIADASRKPEMTIVHGLPARADRIPLSLRLEQPARNIMDAFLVETSSEPRFTDIAAVSDALLPLQQEWAGIIRVGSEPTWPQMPLALAWGRAPRHDRRLTWGPNQGVARLEATLAALRDVADAGAGAVTAAGIDVRRFLSDAVLRLDHASGDGRGLERDVAIGLDAHRLWQMIDDYLGYRISVWTATGQISEATLTRVTLQSDGTTIGFEWGPDIQTSVEAGLASAWARLATGHGPASGLAGTGAFGRVTDSSIHEWNESAFSRLRARRVALRTTLIGSDPLIGTLPVTVGTAWLEPTCEQNP